MVEGEGIKEGTAGQPTLFTLDGRKAGPGQLSCRCRAPSGQMTYVLISDNKVNKFGYVQVYQPRSQRLLSRQLKSDKRRWDRGCRFIYHIR